MPGNVLASGAAMSDEVEPTNERGAPSRALRGVGKKADRLTELATALAAGLNSHYGLDVPLHEVIRARRGHRVDPHEHARALPQGEPVMRIMLTMLVLSLLSGCAVLSGDGTKGQEFAVRSSIQLATVRVIDGDTDRADRVVTVATQARELVSGDTTAALDDVEDAVRDEIRWDRLTPVESQVASDLIELVRAEIEARIGDGVLKGDDRVAVRNVLDWIIDAAERAVERQSHVPAAADLASA